MTHKALRIVFLMLLPAVFLAGSSHAQLEANLGGLTQENARKYLKPLPDAFSGALNTAIFRTGHIPDNGISLRVGLEAVVVGFNDKDRTYRPAHPVGFVTLDQGEAVSAPTVIGDGDSRMVRGQAGTALYYPGGFDIGSLMIATPQLSFGYLYGTQAVVRFIAVDLGDVDLGEIQLLGLGLQHSVSRYFDDLPLDLAAGFFYQSFRVGKDLIKSNALHFNVTGSRRFGVLEPYVGLGIDSYSMDVEYESGLDTGNTDIKLSFDSKNSLHFTLGASLVLPVVQLHAEINQANSTAIAAGLSIGR